MLSIQLDLYCMQTLKEHRQKHTRQRHHKSTKIIWLQDKLFCFQKDPKNLDPSYKAKVNAHVVDESREKLKLNIHASDISF